MNNPFIKTLRNFFLILLIFLAYFSGIGPLRDLSWAEEFPSREIKLMVSHAPGGGVDFVARVFADKVEKILGVPMVVVNNTAGGGVVGALSVAQAKPDGYTLFAGPTTIIITKPILNPECPYRHTDFIQVCLTVGMPFVLFVQAEAPWKDLKELIDYGKKNPRKLRATVGTAGGLLEVLTNLFNAEAGVNIRIIPTKAGVSQTAALLGGHAELCMDSIIPGINNVTAGKLRALVSTHKVPGFPMIKTFEEAGYPGVSLKNVHGIFAPKNLPTPILNKLAKAYEEASNAPSLREQLEKQYILPDYHGPNEASKLFEIERETTLKVMKQSGMIK